MGNFLICRISLDKRPADLDLVEHFFANIALELLALEIGLNVNLGLTIPRFSQDVRWEQRCVLYLIFLGRLHIDSPDTVAELLLYRWLILWCWNFLVILVGMVGDL